SSTSAGLTFVCSRSPFRVKLSSSTGCQPLSCPARRPNGVRSPPTMTASRLRFVDMSLILPWRTRPAEGRILRPLRGYLDHAEARALWIRDYREATCRRVHRSHHHPAAELLDFRHRGVGIVDGKVHQPVRRHIGREVVTHLHAAGNALPIDRP